MHALAMILALSTIGANDFTVTTLGSGAAANASTTTSSDVTIAVSSAGNDTGGQPTVITGGDYSSMPFATIQAALDALPDLVCHDVEIDVGTGTFAGALVSKQGCAASPDSYPWIRIYGTRAAATLASGSVSGTATSGGTSTLTLTGASWTVDDLQGRILYVTAGTGAGEYVIATNTTDTITIPAVATFDGTSVFQLEDLATVVSAPRGGGYTGGYVFEVYRNRTSTVVRDVKITYSDSLANGVFVSHATALAQRVVMAASSSYDGFKVHDGGVLSVFDCGYLGTTDHAAFSAYGQTAAMYYSGIMADVTGIGIRAVYGGEISDSDSGGIWIEATTDGIHLNDCNKTARASLVSVHVADTQNGIYMDNCTATLDTVDIDDTTSKTIYAHESELIIDTALTGTGNVWGIDLSQPGNMLYVSTTPTITGSSGEVTFDGTNAVTWTQAVSGSPGVIISDNVQYTGHAYYGPAAAPADFPRAAMIVSSYDTPANGGTAYIGIVSEESADASSKGIGIWGIGYQPAGSTQFAYGVRGGAYADSSATGNVFAGSFTASSSRAAGANVALFANATGAAENYAFRILSGDFDNLASMNWDLHDNDSTPALSFNTDGLSCLLCFDTSNSAEKISTGATLELGAALDANGNDILDGSGSLSLNDDVVVSGDLTVGGDTVLSTPTDGDLLVANSAGTQGVHFDTQTDGALLFRNESGAVSTNLVIGGTQIYFGSGVSVLTQRVGSSGNYIAVNGYYGVQLLHIGDLDQVSRGLFEFGQSNSSYELTGSSGVQYGMSLGNTTVPFEVDQSGTSGYHALHIDVTETATGSGEKHLINVGVGGASKFSIDNGGELSASGISGDGSGKAVCIKADGNLGTCTDAVGAGGTCTCN